MKICYITGVASETSFMNRTSGINLGKNHSLIKFFLLFYCFYFCSSSYSRLVLVGYESPFCIYLLNCYSCTALSACKLPECNVMFLQAICMSCVVATPVI
jgi:hypothetical protein